jgi:hypothetical protein
VSLPTPVTGDSFDSRTIADGDLLRRWRTYSRTTGRLRLAFSVAVVAAMVGMLAAIAGGGNRPGVQLGIFAVVAIVMLTLPQFAVRYRRRLARSAGLACRDCDRPLDDSTILFALDTGQCWHCHPPVAAEEIASAPTSPAEASEVINPYQPPTITERPASTVAPPPTAVTDVTFSTSLIVGPLATLVIYQLLTQPEEPCLRNNPPRRPFESAEEEAEYRRQAVRVSRRHGWYLLAWMLAAAGLALAIASLQAPPLGSPVGRLLYYGTVFVLASAAAFWSAYKLARLAPRPLRRWLNGSMRPVPAKVDPETGLLSIHLTFPAHDLSALPQRRRLSVRWRSEEPRPLNVILWRQGTGEIHRQSLPPSASPGLWNDSHCAVPYALAGDDARWSEVKVVMALDPPGSFEVEDVSA